MTARTQTQAVLAAVRAALAVPPTDLLGRHKHTSHALDLLAGCKGVWLVAARDSIRAGHLDAARTLLEAGVDAEQRAERARMDG